MDYQYAYRLAFLGEWFQEEASMSRNFSIFFYPADSAIEIFDLKTKKVFLKRTRVENVSQGDFYIGGKVNIFGRQITILDFGDEATRKKLAHLRQRTFMIIKPEAVENLGMILKILAQNDFTLNNGRMVQFQGNDLLMLFGHNFDHRLSGLSMMAGPTIGLELVADNAVEKLKNLVGPEDPDVAKQENPCCLRAMFGQNIVKNAIHVAATCEAAHEESCRFFNTKQPFKTTEVLERSTLAIIKPHAIKSGQAGDIIMEIVQNGFRITALKMLLMDRQNCEEFYEVYRGVLSDFVQMVSQLSSGLCMALELVAVDENRDTHAEFRQFCGPMDPSVAQPLRPNTLRAKFGKTKILNAIHCTDLPEDTLLEVEYFFKLLE